MWDGDQADDNSREWILRYAPDILYKYLIARERQMQTFPGTGSPARNPDTGRIQRANPNDPESPALPGGPGYELLLNIRKILQSKRGRQRSAETPARARGAIQNNHGLSQPSAMDQLSPRGRKKAYNLALKERIANGQTSTGSLQVDINGQTVRLGTYRPRENYFVLFPEDENNHTLRTGYGMDSTISYDDPNFLSKLEATAIAMQEDLGLQEPPKVYLGRRQIWPPTGSVRENIQHSLSHLPNGKLIKEQIAKAFADKDINISRKRLEEVIRKHIIQELINNA